LAFFKFNPLGLASSFLLFYTALSNNPWWTVYGGTGIFLRGSSDIFFKGIGENIEEQDEEVPQQHKHEDSEEHRGDNNGGSNCA